MPTSTIQIQVGQCGNQLGSALLSSLAAPSVDSPSTVTSSPSLPPPPPSCYFRTTPQGVHLARAVLVDTEPKVINKCLSYSRHEKGFAYSRFSGATVGAGGAANNWARGYNFGAESLEPVMEKLRSEVEKAECLEAFHVVHSVAGGTGSGMGCAITARARDDYGSKTLLWNTAVSPFEGGEVIVQDYNATLTLAALQGTSDGVLVAENEEAERACKLLMKVRSKGRC